MSEERQFNLMFSTVTGPIADSASTAYLRPETAQGVYTNFNNICKSLRPKLPFGVAQSGKAFRNEITIGNFLFRSREFEQMEIQWFCHETEADNWFQQWLKEGHMWLKEEIGLREESIRLVNHPVNDLAHYALRTTDIEFQFPFGWGELWGFSNRGTYDLGCHGLSYRDPNNPKNIFVPTVVEPALGLTRLVLAILCDSYIVEEITNQKGEPDKRTVLQIAPNIAPYSVAVTSLIGKDESQCKIAETIFHELARSSSENYPTIDITSAKIGKKYRRQDEIGTPYCVTVDYDSVNDRCVTLRDRDSMKQVRLPIERLLATPIKNYKKIINENSDY